MEIKIIIIPNEYPFFSQNNKEQMWRAQSSMLSVTRTSHKCTFLCCRSKQFQKCLNNFCTRQPLLSSNIIFLKPFVRFTTKIIHVPMNVTIQLDLRSNSYKKKLQFFICNQVNINILNPSASLVHFYCNPIVIKGLTTGLLQ